MLAVFYFQTSIWEITSGETSRQYRLATTESSIEVTDGRKAVGPNEIRGIGVQTYCPDLEEKSMLRSAFRWWQPAADNYYRIGVFRVIAPMSTQFLQVLLLLLLANGTPIIAKKLLGQRWAYPVDGGKLFVDGRPWFGVSKTVRGVLLSVTTTALGAYLMGIGLWTGAIFATASMTGDLLSSFIKRRRDMPPSSMALGLDQLPESVLPLLVCWRLLGLTALDAITIVTTFFFVELAISRLLFRWHVRDRPY